MRYFWFWHIGKWIFLAWGFLWIPGLIMGNDFLIVSGFATLVALWLITNILYTYFFCKHDGARYVRVATVAETHYHQVNDQHCSKCGKKL